MRYCETLTRCKPSEEQLLRRQRRKSRKSMEFMLGLESLFDQWDRDIERSLNNLPEVSLFQVFISDESSTAISIN